MRCYTARAQGQEDGTIVVARNGSQAADIFVCDYISQHGQAPGAFTVALNDLRQVPLLDDLRLMIKGDVAGIAEFDEETGYSLRPIGG
jgi:hypothetical protein